MTGAVAGYVLTDATSSRRGRSAVVIGSRLIQPGHDAEVIFEAEVWVRPLGGRAERWRWRSSAR